MAADAGLPRVGRQVLATIFTNGAQFKHVKSPALNEARNNRTEGLGICPANCRSSGKTTLSDIHKMTGPWKQSIEQTGFSTSASHTRHSDRCDVALSLTF
jgi:hypothetical protein